MYVFINLIYSYISKSIAFYIILRIVLNMNPLTFLLAISIITTLTKSEVVKLTDKTFNKTRSSSPILMVKFYAPWCLHCKAMASEYSAAAKLAKSRYPNFVIGELDVTENKQTVEEKEIKRFPTIILYVKGAEPIVYEGERKAEDILNFMVAKTLPVVRVKSKLEVQKAIKDGKVTVFVYAAKGSVVQKIGDKLAKEFDEIQFLAVEYTALLSTILGEEKSTNKTAKTALSAKPVPAIIVKNNWDAKPHILKTELKEENIKKFIQEKTVSPVLSFTQKTIQKVIGKFTPAMILFKENEGNNTKLVEDYKKVALELRGERAYFIMSDIKEGLSQVMGDYLGVRAKDMPVVYILNPDGAAKKYIMKKEKYQMNYSGMKSFFEDWKNNKVDMSPKSQKVPEKQEGPVFTLVADNFEKEVLKSGKDVLVKFFTPWCGHCMEVFIYIYIYIL